MKIVSVWSNPHCFVWFSPNLAGYSFWLWLSVMGYIWLLKNVFIFNVYVLHYVLRHVTSGFRWKKWMTAIHTYIYMHLTNVDNVVIWNGTNNHTHRYTVIYSDSFCNSAVIFPLLLCPSCPKLAVSCRRTYHQYECFSIVLHRSCE